MLCSPSFGGTQVCSTVRHLVAELRRVAPDIEELLRAARISRADFQYPAEEYSLEVIP